MQNTYVFDGYTSITGKTFDSITAIVTDNKITVIINNIEKHIKLVEKEYKNKYVYRLLTRQLATSSIKDFCKFLEENTDKQSLFFTTIRTLLTDIHNK